MNSSFEDRLDFKGDFTELVARIVNDFSLGDNPKYQVIEVGFEDFNLKISTSTGEYVAKIFSKKRSVAEIDRYVTIIQKAIQGGVNHPRVLYVSEGQMLHQDAVSGLKMIVMDFIKGKAFYELKTLPTDDDLKLICAEAVKINAINYDPPYLFDSWAIPNMRWMFDKTKDHLTQEGLALVQKAFDYYDAIPFDELPKSFVHGDLTKANTIKGDDGKLYVIDFAVANTYPRIQELAVMAANLLFDEKADRVTPLADRVNRVMDAYQAAGGVLTEVERDNLFNYSLPATAMEYMGSVHERMVGDTSEEIVYWEKLGLDGLRQSLG